MRRLIRLLVENLFDDLYDIDQETNSEIDLADQIYTPEIGSIYYEKKKPYAICCGLDTDFKDKRNRFMLIKKHTTNVWSTYLMFIDELGKHNLDVFWLKSKNKIEPIDENGYENTLIIKNNYDLLKFPSFNYCCNLGDDVYLPAIDELQIMYLNINKLNNKLNNIIKLTGDFWSSTLLSSTYSWSLDICNYIDSAVCGGTEKARKAKIRPFLKL